MADKSFEPNWNEPEYPTPSRRSKVVFFIVIGVVALALGLIFGFAVSR